MSVHGAHHNAISEALLPQCLCTHQTCWTWQQKVSLENHNYEAAVNLKKTFLLSEENQRNAPTWANDEDMTEAWAGVDDGWASGHRFRSFLWLKCLETFYQAPEPHQVCLVLHIPVNLWRFDFSLTCLFARMTTLSFSTLTWSKQTWLMCTLFDAA